MTSPHDPRQEESDDTPEDWHRIEYGQAMETFRSITSQVVSTSGVLALGYVTLLGIALEQHSAWFVVIAGLVPCIIWALFNRWHWFNDTLLKRAANVIPQRESLTLARDLQEWMGPYTGRSGPWYTWAGRKVMLWSPLAVGAVTIVIGAIAVGSDSWR